jgi:hypothetical protein
MTRVLFFFQWGQVGQLELSKEQGNFEIMPNACKELQNLNMASIN